MPILASVAFFSPAPSLSPGSPEQLPTALPRNHPLGTTLSRCPGEWQRREMADQSDSQGQFSLDVPDEKVRHPIRVSQRRVNYLRPAPQCKTTAQVTVNDSAKKVDNLLGEGRIIRLLSAGGLAHVSLFLCPAQPWQHLIGIESPTAVHGHGLYARSSQRRTLSWSQRLREEDFTTGV